MSSNATLLALPACREMADALAQEITGIHDSLFRLLAERFALLLSDLGRPASRDAWVRWILAHDTRPPKARSYRDLRDNPTALLAAILEVADAKQS